MTVPLDSLESINALLARSLGDQVAGDVVRRALAEAGLTKISSREDFLRVLNRIERTGGTAGLAARLALSRAERGVAILDAQKAIKTDPPVPAAPKPAPEVALSEIAKQLAFSLGDAKAEAVVAQAARALKLRGTSVTRAEAIDLLESLIQQGGVVATVARFTKVRFLLEIT